MSYLGLLFTCLVAKEKPKKNILNLWFLWRGGGGGGGGGGCGNQRPSLNKSRGVLLGRSNCVICHIMKMVWPFEKLRVVDWSC